MQTVTMLEFRRDSESILHKLRQGIPLMLTYRGKPVARLEPVLEEDQTRSESLLEMCELGEKLIPDGSTSKLTNEEIDRIVYGL